MNGYLRDYRRSIEEIEKLVSALRTVAFPGAAEQSAGLGGAGAQYYSRVVETYRQTGQDVILRNAPCLIVAMTSKEFHPRGRDNTYFSLAYAELYAPAIELGTCWVGFFEGCASANYQPLLSILNLPENMVVTGGLLV
ncbi:nitroreductase family protein [Desulfosporosinus youngiae DSM 17734]|uniref:Nitroreductase family protein n=1 Tax=Desulfosporosinus youngiae DSM 17734 TaxID=768710 RepID=H5Y3Y5_9FIRM|nr:nitroreductase family protein [Desulfosporosinus youngiae DSM 17734]